MCFANILLGLRASELACTVYTKTQKVLFVYTRCGVGRAFVLHFCGFVYNAYRLKEHRGELYHKVKCEFILYMFYGFEHVCDTVKQTHNPQSYTWNIYYVNIFNNLV